MQQQASAEPEPEPMDPLRRQCAGPLQRPTTDFPLGYFVMDMKERVPTEHTYCGYCTDQFSLNAQHGFKPIDAELWTRLSTISCDSSSMKLGEVMDPSSLFSVEVVDAARPTVPFSVAPAHGMKRMAGVGIFGLPTQLKYAVMIRMNEADLDARFVIESFTVGDVSVQVFEHRPDLRNQDVYIGGTCMVAGWTPGGAALKFVSVTSGERELLRVPSTVLAGYNKENVIRIRVQKYTCVSKKGVPTPSFGGVGVTTGFSYPSHFGGGDITRLLSYGSPLENLGAGGFGGFGSKPAEYSAGTYAALPGGGFSVTPGGSCSSSSSSNSSSFGSFGAGSVQSLPGGGLMMVPTPASQTTVPLSGGTTVKADTNVSLIPVRLTHDRYERNGPPVEFTLQLACNQPEWAKELDNARMQMQAEGFDYFVREGEELDKECTRLRALLVDKSARLHDARRHVFDIRGKLMPSFHKPLAPIDAVTRTPQIDAIIEKNKRKRIESMLVKFKEPGAASAL